MRAFACILLFSILLAISTHAAEPIVLHVSPAGNDAWSGSLSEPNTDGTDGPFATLSGARDAIRRMKATGPLAGPVNVQVRGGVYRIGEPLAFGPEDSGTHDAPITYEAHAGEKPVISGGVVVAGWKQEGDLWVADVAGAAAAPGPFSALWVDGEPRTLARTPNEGFFLTDGKAEVIGDDAGNEIQNAHNSIRYKPGDIQRWDGLSDALVVALFAWDITKLHVDVLDEANCVLRMRRGEGGWEFNRWDGDNQRYYVENMFEALDQPGEWYLDRKAKKLFYWPKEGEDMATTEVVAPMVNRLVLLTGDTATGSFVRHIHFKGLAFHHTDYSLGPEGMNSQQASASVHAAFHAIGARDCSVQDCEIAHVSNYGVWFGSGCQDNLIARNNIHDLGAGGVRIGEGGGAANEHEVCRHNVVDNNWIHDGGKIFAPGVGVWIGKASYNTISHNEISDFYYTGVSVGWSWGYAPSTANHNIIEYNHIHHIGKRVLSDMGGIYLLGLAPGTMCRNNLIHDILSHSYGGWGIYPDEGSTDLLIENNIIYNTKTGGFHQHYGKENRVANNIFAFSHEGQIQRTRQEEHISFFFERNIVLFNNGNLLSSNWGDDKYEMDFNCYWDISGKEISFAGMNLAEWQAKGKDRHSVVADPLFENAEAFDFRLKPESPALALGFRPIDVSTVGLYGDEQWVNSPKTIQREPSELPKP